jgi:uncharacterized membrane protein YqjE
MLKMLLVLFPVIATTLMGIAVITVVSVDMQAGWQPIALAAVGGFLAAIPFSWLIGKKVVEKTGW